MKAYICLVLIVWECMVGYSAPNFSTVTGQVVSEETEESISYASVKVFDTDSTLINGGITLENGSFTLSGLAQGTYLLTVSRLGYEAYQTELLIGQLNENYDLGKIPLTPSAVAIDEVEIFGNRSEISADLGKKSYNVDGQIAQSGGSVMDAMKAMPSISFDQEGKVILRGSDKVLVLIDGKQSSLTGYGNQRGLASIPAANIERIEIINNPSAKYDAAGMAGIINIVYKKEKEKGLLGRAGFSYGLGVLSKRQEDLPTDLGSYNLNPKYIPSLDLSLKKDKVSFALQSQILFQEGLPNNEFTTRTYNDGRVIASQVPENRTQTRIILNGGVELLLTGNQLLSFSAVYDWEKHTDTAQVPYVNPLTQLRNRFIAWNEEEITGFMNYAAQYEYKFPQVGHVLQARAQYTRGWEDETYFINDSSRIRSQGRDVTSVLGVEHTTSLLLDYTKPLSKGRVETGVKLQIRDLPVDYTQQRGEQSILYPGLGNWTKWGEQIYAAYGNWVHEQPAYSIEAGVRAEYTSVFYTLDPANIYYQENDAYDYFRVFPNIRFSYKLNEFNRFSVFYSYRVDRPGEPQLRMYPKSDDHELVKVGNPYLRPQFTQSVELGYKTDWSQGSLFIAGFARWIQDPFMRVYTQDTSNRDFDIVLKSYANTGRATNIGIEVVGEQQLLPFWKASGNISIYQNKIFAHTGQLLFPYEHSFDIAKSSENNVEAKLIQTWELDKGLQLQLTYLYIGPKNIPQGRQLARSSLDFGINKRIQKGELFLSFSDIFNRYGIREELSGEGFLAAYQNFFETQVLRVGMRYSF